MSEVAHEGASAPAGEMTFDQAAAAISEATASDPEFTPGLPAELPAQEAPVAPADQAVEPPTPTEDPAPGADEFSTATDESENSFMGGDFNPDLLPDELKPGFKQLQAEWTRKTQSLAEQRKALEALGSQEELQTAAEFYQSLQDPEYLKSFYGELGNVVREMGLVDEDPSAPTPTEPAEATPAELPAELAQLVESDPEMKPLAERLASMEKELSGFREAQAQERKALDDERQLMAEAAEIDRMVQVVREQHPDYGDEDWQAIYDRAVAFDGNVLQAAELYAADQDRIVQAYLSRKPVPQAVTPTPGAATVTEGGDDEPMTLEQADKAAQAYLDANDLAEFTG